MPSMPGHCAGTTTSAPDSTGTSRAWAPRPRMATMGQVATESSHLVRSRNRCSRATTPSPWPGSTSRMKVSASMRVTRSHASTLPWGCNSNDHADSPGARAAMSWASCPWRNVSVSGPVAVTTSRVVSTAAGPAANAAGTSRVSVVTMGSCGMRSWLRRDERRPAAPGPCSRTRGTRARRRCRPRSRRRPGPTRRSA